jgi:hypothetical protein
MVELNEPNCQRFRTTLITFLILSVGDGEKQEPAFIDRLLLDW